MEELINELKKENQDILHKNPKLAMEFDWSGDAYRLQYNEEMIGKLKLLLIPRVVNNDSGVCPTAKKCKIIMFTSDLDICQKCNKTFEGK